MWRPESTIKTGRYRKAIRVGNIKSKNEKKIINAHPFCFSIFDVMCSFQIKNKHLKNDGYLWGWCNSQTCFSGP